MHGRTRQLTAGTALAVLVAGGLLAGGGAAVASPAATGSSGHLETAQAAGTTAPPATPDASPTTGRSHGSRAIPRSNAGKSAPGAVVAGPAATAAAAPLLTNLNGVSSRDSEFTNYNAEFEPPDQGLCSGNGFVIEAVNSAYSIYTTAGKRIRGPFNVNDLFNEGGKEFTSDPRCTYDQATHRFFAVVLFINDTNTRSRTDVAVSRTSDPTGLWDITKLDTTDNGTMGEPRHPGCPCLGDQPLLGIDRSNIYVSTNEFSLAGSAFNGAQVYALSKADLIAAGPVHVVHFDRLSIGGAIATSIQPAITYGSAPAEYFLNSLDPNATFDNRIGVWALQDPGAVANGGSPTLSSVVLSSEAYGIPPAAPQRGATSTLNSGDDRMQQVEWIDGTLWGSLGTALTVPGDSAERAGAAWFTVAPSVAGGSLGAHLLGQGYVRATGTYLLYPALQADRFGRAAMVFTETGPGMFPGAGYATATSPTSGFSAPTLAAAGSGPYDPKATRWGDYSAASLDPSTDTVWLATEYVPPVASQTTDGRRNWGTRVLQVAVGR